jgi:hypothetical protein
MFEEVGLDRGLDSNNIEINKYYGFPLPWY